MSRWHRLLLGAVFVLMACGPALAQQVQVLGWTNGTIAGATVSATITTFEAALDPNANVLVVGFYGDNSSTYGDVTFGGVAPTGFQNVNASGQSRLGLAYWFNPNDASTYPNHDIVVNYNNGGNGGYYWAYQLAGVNTNAPVFTNGPTTKFASTTTLTNTQYNTLIISYYSVNASTTVNALTPNSPLIQCGSTRGNLGSGASIASATNNIFAPGIQTISWNSTIGTANQGLGVIGFVAGQLGAPGVLASATPSGGAAPGQTFTVTATIYPGVGTVTNVSVDLTPIGGSAVNNLVQSSNPNIWTNTLAVPGGAPYPLATNFTVTATQDTQPLQGSGPLQYTVVAPAPPMIAQDIQPTNNSGFIYLYVGQGVTFSASFTGPQPITYQWQFSTDSSSFTDIPGATNTTYTIASARLSDYGYYQLVASNQFGTTPSSIDYVYVDGSSTPTYLWSAPIPFAGLTAEQILTNFPSANKIAGAMVAQNGGNPITVILTNANNQPVVFAGAGNWATLSGGAGYRNGANTNQTGNASFNACLNNFYFDNATHTIALRGLTVGQSYQVQLFALDNRAGNGGRMVNYQDPANPDDIVQNMAMGDNVYVLGTFTATNSVMTIQQNMMTSAGNFNGLVLRTVGWEPAPYFVLQPVNTNVFLGTNVTLGALAAGDSTITGPTITYQWAAGPTNGPYADLTEGTKYAGVTTTALTISNLAASDGDVVYVLRASNSGGTTTSAEAHVYVQSPLVLPAPGSFGAAVLALTTNRLVGFWQLNETNDPSSGLLLAIDASGKGHSGTYANNAHNGFNGALSPQPPTFGGFATNQGALQTGVGGTSDTNSVVMLPALNTTNGVDTTICMWINPSAVVGANTALIYNRSSIDQCGIQFGGTTGGDSGQRNLAAFWANANGEATYNFNTGLFPANNTWNFIVLVVRTNALTYYLDYVDANGVAHLQKSADTASRYTQQVWGGTPIWIGGDPNGGATIFPGSIAEVAMFNSALSDSQISALFSVAYGVAGFPAGFAQQPPATTTNYIGFTVQISAQTGGSAPITNQWMFNGAKLVDGWYNGSIVVGSTSNVLTILNATTNWNDGVFNLAITNVLAGVVSSNATITILPPVAPPAGNLVGRWLAGTQTLADVSGYLPGVHDGSQIMTNGVARGVLIWTNDLPPNNSGGSSLRTVNAGIQINNTSTNDAGYEATFDAGISNAMTVSFWAKGWPGQWNPFVSKYGETTPSPAGGWQVRNDGGNNVSPCWTIRGNPGTVALGTAVGGNAEDMGATSLTYGNDGKWHYYCATYDVNAGQRMLYVDGSLVAYTTGQGQYTTVPLNHLVIGARDPGGTNAYAAFYTGLLYDVRIYNVALTQSQQASLAGAPPLPAQKITASVTPPSGGNPGQMVLNWLTGGSLLQSTNVTGPWTTNTAATPPYTVPMTNRPAEFYKVLFQ